MAQSDYERARTNLSDLIAWAELNDAAGKRNEATTRLHLIDRLFFECLSWPIEDCVTEERFDGRYADYALGRPYRRLLVEAKREGVYFELPAGFESNVCDIQTLTEGNEPIARALRQVSDYCQERGIALAAVSNGFQIIAFLGSRLDGIAPLRGRALVFASHQAMRDNFRLLWNNLSPPGIEALNIYQTLSAPAAVRPPERLSQHLVGYPGFKARNYFQTDLQILGGLFLQDVVENPEVEPEFLRECYCTSGALSQYALVSREILKTRYSALMQTETDVQAHPAADKAGISQQLAADIVAASMSRRPIILLGDVGVGKTVFLRHLIQVEARDLLERAIVMYVDFGSRPALEDDINGFIMDEFARQLLDGYDIDVDDAALVRGVYHGELLRFGRSIYGPLREVDEAAYLREEIRFLSDKVQDRPGHLRACFEHIVKGQRRQIVIVLDNVDQRPFEFQERVFLVSHSLAQTWPGTVFISLRPETFYRSKITGSLSAYQPRVFTVSPPRVDQVINKRLIFAKKQLDEHGRLETFPQGVTVRSDTLSQYIDVLIRSFGQSRDLIEVVDNLSGGNVRTALGFIQAFIGSAHVDTSKIMKDAERYRIPLHEFMRAVIYGDNAYYDPVASPVVNMFDISSPDGREHFLLPISLAYVAKYGEKLGQEGFVALSDLNGFLQAIGFQPSQVKYAIDRALTKRLIEASPHFGEDLGDTRVRITTIGAYQLSRLIAQFVYVDAVVVDTPILAENWRKLIRDEDWISDRLRRAEVFRAYLDRQWHPLSAKDVIFEWPQKSAELRDEVTWIGRRVDPENWP